MPTHIEVVEQLIDTWRRQDVDGVLDLLTEDIVYHFHVGSRPLVGKDWVRRFLEKFGAGMTDVRWKITHHATNGSRLFVEGVDDFVDADGDRIRTPYMGVFEFRGDKICGWRDYVDLKHAEDIKAGKPIPDWLEAIM